MSPFRRMPRLVPVALVLALGLAGCAPRTLQQLYVPSGSGAGYGYAAHMVGARDAVVTYDAPLDTAFTYEGPAGQQAVDATIAQAHDLALLRAADLALAQAFPAFRVTNRTNDVNVRRFYDPYPFGFGYPYYHRHGFPPYFTPYGFPYEDSYEVLYVRVTLNVTLEPSVTKGAYNAAEVQTTLRARYAPPPGG